MSEPVPELDPPHLARRMPFMDHLTELRTRLRNSLIGLLFTTSIAYAFRGHLEKIFAQPLMQAFSKVPPEWRTLNFTSPLEAFMVPFKISLIGGLFLGLPVIFHQIWAFVSPGLYPRERRLAFPFIVSAVVLFVGGAGFAYFFVLPKSYAYFMGYATDLNGIVSDVFTTNVDMKFQIKPMITLDDYWALTSKLMLVFGAVFELPLVLGLLAILGMVTPGSLWRFNRYFVLLSFVAGAVLTPGDLVVGQIAMGGALTVLYNISILVALVVRRKPRAAEAEGEAEAAPGPAAAQ